jgi:hypothetical protein
MLSGAAAVQVVVFWQSGSLSSNTYYPWTEFVETDHGGYAAAIPNPDHPRKILTRQDPLPGLDDVLGRVEVTPGQFRDRDEAHPGEHRVGWPVVQCHEHAEPLNRRDDAREHLSAAKPAQERPQLPVPGRGDRELDCPLAGIDGDYPGGDWTSDVCMGSGEGIIDWIPLQVRVGVITRTEDITPVEAFALQGPGQGKCG